MNIMGIGPMEMGIIAVVALLIFGPGKLPEVMGQAGKMVRDFRRMSAELTGEFEKTIAEAKDVGNSITGEIGGMSKEVTSVTNSVKKDLGLKGGTATSRSSAGSKAGAGTTAKRTGASSTAGTKSSTATKAGGNASSSGPTAATRRAGTSSATTSTSSTTTTTAKPKPAAKPPVPKSSREDPVADVSLFEVGPVERVRRSRKATPAIIEDPTPRLSAVTPAPGSDGTASDGDPAIPRPVSDDPLQRARERRRSAGYARTSA